MGKLKILGFDCDGVVNSAAYLKTLKTPEDYPLDPLAVNLITDLLASDFDIKILLTSSWRHYPEALRKLTNVGIPILDMTPALMRTRGDEVSVWLAEHESEVFSYALVDDNNDYLKQQQKRLVKTDFATGLLPEHILKIRRIIACPLNSPVILQ